MRMLQMKYHTEVQCTTQTQNIWKFSYAKKLNSNKYKSMFNVKKSSGGIFIQVPWDKMQFLLLILIWMNFGMKIQTRSFQQRNKKHSKRFWRHKLVPHAISIDPTVVTPGLGGQNSITFHYIKMASRRLLTYKQENDSHL